MSGAPNGRAARFDLDAAAKAAVAEHGPPVPFRFTFHGKGYDIPAATTWPLEAQSMIGRGDLEGALVMLLGQAAYDGLVAAGITVGELTILFEAVGADAGVGGLPNSPPPAPRVSTPT